MLHKGRQILAPFSQRRQLNGEHNDAMIQVAPESAGINKLFEIAMRSDYHADIDSSRFGRADAFDLTLLQDAKQFGLHGGGHVANLVQEKRTAMRLFELARVSLGGAGK